MSQGSYNVLEHGAKLDGTGDLGAVVNAGFTAGYDTILLPAIPAGYRVATSMTPGSGQKVIGINGVPLLTRAASTNVDFFTSVVKTDLHIENLQFDGNSSNSGTGKGIYSHISDRCRYWDLRFTNMSDACIMNYQGTNANIKTVYATGGTSHCIYLDAHVRGNIEDVLTGGSLGGFTIFGTTGSHHNHIRNIRTTSSLLELCTLDGNHNKISNAMATGTQDNGITLVGDYNELYNFHSYSNYNNGLMINGSYNMVSNYVGWNNNQRPTAGSNAHSGLKIESGFGGFATGNQICNVQMFDDQGTPTQWGGVTLGANGYNQWVSGATLPASNYFVYYLNNVYTSDGGSGVMGSTAPTHTSGSVANGAVTLRFLKTTTVGFHATDNQCVNIKYRNNKTANKIDNATLGTNTGF